MTSDDLKREFDRDRLIALAKAEGLGAKWQRIECPERCSPDPRGCSVGENGLYQCKRCNKGGSAIDLLMAVRRLDFAQAAEALKLVLGKIPAPPKSKEEKPRDGRKLFEALPLIDPAGNAYLKARGLGHAADRGLVRFNTGKSGDRWLDARAEEGYRIAVPLYNTDGVLCSFQLRSIVQGADPTKLALARCPYPKTGAFFRPGLGSSVLHVAEGMTDTLALSLAGAFVVGVPGQDQLPKIPALYPAAAWAGMTVVLCPQNDQPAPGKKTSRDNFSDLERALLALHANVCWHETPERFSDPADHLRGSREEFLSSLAPHKPPARAEVPRGTPQLSVVGAPPAPLPIAHDAARPLSQSYASICQILRTPALRAKVLGDGKLEFNELTLMPCLDRRPISPMMISRLREKCEHEFEDRKRRPIEFARSDIEQALVAIAQEQSFHPVASWLSSLKWDGQERVRFLADEILELPKVSDLERLMLRKWMVSAVARALDPGCQVDTVLVLVGKQGNKKSSFFRGLAGEWFSDASMSLEQKDAMLVMHRAWILEWAELEAMQRARDQGSVKAFVTRRADDFRPPYGREVESHPRRCVIVGTTNLRDFLSDPTGERRYWPIEAPAKINLAGLEAQREQLWAEAVAIYRAAEACKACRLPLERCPDHSWHLKEADEKLLRIEHEKFAQVDPWEENIVSFLESPRAEGICITNSVLLEEALKMPPKEKHRANDMRIASIMEGLGWTQTRRVRGPGQRERIREWLPPAQPSQPQPDLFPGRLGRENPSGRE